MFDTEVWSDDWNNEKRREKMRIGITELNEGQDFYFFNYFVKANNRSLLTRKGIQVELEYF